MGEKKTHHHVDTRAICTDCFLLNNSYQFQNSYSVCNLQQRNISYIFCLVLTDTKFEPHINFLSYHAYSFCRFINRLASLENQDCMIARSIINFREQISSDDIHELNRCVYAILIKLSFFS